MPKKATNPGEEGKVAKSLVVREKASLYPVDKTSRNFLPDGHSVQGRRALFRVGRGWKEVANQ